MTTRTGPFHPTKFPARVLIAPDKFKGTLSAPAAARAMAAGVRRFAGESGRAEPEILLRPLADGGEGSHDVLKELPGKDERTLPLTAASGNTIPVPYLATDSEAGAKLDFFLETALVIGLQNADNRALDIEDRTTAGVGEWIDRLVRANLGSRDRPAAARTLVFHLFLGGSATSDGGFGLARSLGFSFFDEDDAPIHDLRGLDRLKTVLAPDPTLFDPVIRVFVYTDVSSPLLGPSGAARLYGPQKGASPEQVEGLEERLRRFQTALIAATGRIETDLAGLGAAGGLSLPLVYWPRARTEFVSGIDFFLDATGIDGIFHERPPDLVLTGEGSADRGTLEGKVPAGLARRLSGSDTPVVLCAGIIKPEDRPALAGSEQFAAIFDTIEFTGPLHELPGETEAAERLTKTVAAGLARLYGG